MGRVLRGPAGSVEGRGLFAATSHKLAREGYSQCKRRCGRVPYHAHFQRMKLSFGQRTWGGGSIRIAHPAFFLSALYARTGVNNLRFTAILSDSRPHIPHMLFSTHRSLTVKTSGAPRSSSSVGHSPMLPLCAPTIPTAHQTDTTVQHTSSAAHHPQRSSATKFNIYRVFQGCNTQHCRSVVHETSKLVVVMPFSRPAD